MGRPPTSSFTFSDREMPVIFGRHHLLSRVTNDPVGEEFLAAWGVDQGVDQLRKVFCIYPRVAEETEFVSLFSEESRALSRLSSANVVRVMEVGVESGIPYVAREHVEGLTLERLMELADSGARLWPWELATHVTMEILRGLDYVHRREDLHGSPMGMRHGDIRPRNVIVSFNGEVKLTGFGSTLRFIADEKTNARLSEVRGRFLPPDGDGSEPSVGADLWAVGLVFLMLLGGRPPSRTGEQPIQAWVPPQMSSRVEAMPGVMDAFIGRALNPDPAFRFETPEEMRAALVKIMTEHAAGHPPDDLAAWTKDLGDADRRAEEDLVRRLLRQEPSLRLDEAATGTGALTPGMMLDGRYHLVRLLGEGGMGLVFEAEHMGLGRRMAVKVLHERVLDDASTVERFRREAQIIGSLGHPNIVGATDFGVTPEGHHYLAMDLLEGKSLAHRIWEGNLSPKELIGAMAEVCDGLQAAHDAKVIHRDLKPDNIFLTPAGARILDFGIAKTTGLDESSDALTRTGHICGTVDYIAPEQIRGIGGDPRSDIYAVGVIIYEALTGTTPFHGRTVGESLHKVMNDKLVPPRKRTGDKTIPAALETVCLKALNRRADRRYASAAEMAEALRGILPTARRRSSDGEGGAKAEVAGDRRRGFFLAAGILAALGIAGAVAWSLMGSGSSADEPGGETTAAADTDQAPAQKEKEPAEEKGVVVEIPEEKAATEEPTAKEETPTAEKVAAPEEKAPAESDDEAARLEAVERAKEKVKEGEAALARMDLAAAGRAFSEAVKLDSRNSRAWYGLGKTAYQKGDYADAAKKTERSLRYSPGNVSRRIFLGKVYGAAGKKAEARAQFERVLKTHPENEQAAKLLAKYK